jgi:hypothetical protein
MAEAARVLAHLQGTLPASLQPVAGVTTDMPTVAELPRRSLPGPKGQGSRVQDHLPFIAQRSACWFDNGRPRIAWQLHSSHSNEPFVGEARFLCHLESPNPTVAFSKFCSGERPNEG